MRRSEGTQGVPDAGGAGAPKRSGTVSNVMEAPRNGKYRGCVVINNQTRAGARHDGGAT
jgi:hypothetical protein